MENRAVELKCRTFEEIMQNYTEKTELSERSEENLPEEIKDYMRRLVGHNISSYCYFKNETDQDIANCIPVIYSDFSGYAVIASYSSGEGPDYWLLRSDGIVCLFDFHAEADAGAKYGDELYSFDTKTFEELLAVPLGINFTQFITAIDLYAQWEKIFEQFDEDDRTIRDNHVSGECSDTCKVCILNQEFKTQLSTIDQNLSKNWPI